MLWLSWGGAATLKGAGFSVTEKLGLWGPGLQDFKTSSSSDKHS
jgi:hypothetical protein